MLSLFLNMIAASAQNPLSPLDLKIGQVAEETAKLAQENLATEDQKKLAIKHQNERVLFEQGVVDSYDRNIAKDELKEREGMARLIMEASIPSKPVTLEPYSSEVMGGYFQNGDAMLPLWFFDNYFAKVSLPPLCGEDFSKWKNVFAGNPCFMLVDAPK